MTEIQPLLNYHHLEREAALVPNFGTVVDFAPWPEGKSKRRIGDWRLCHPDLVVFVAYGVNASCYPDGLWGLGHGSHIGVEGRGMTRYYWFGAGNPDWDNLLLPQRILVDWDEGKLNRQLHFPDLKWFDPYYGSGVEVRSREELGREIKRRVVGLTCVKSKGVRGNTSPDGRR